MAILLVIFLVLGLLLAWYSNYRRRNKKTDIHKEVLFSTITLLLFQGLVGVGVWLISKGDLYGIFPILVGEIACYWHTKSYIVTKGYTVIK